MRYGLTMDGTEMFDPTNSNFARALGIDITQCLESEFVTEIQPAARNACFLDPTNIDLLSVPGFIDHSAGAAIHSLNRPNSGTATVDLRTDFFTDRVIGVLKAKTQIVAASNASATTLTQVHDSERLVAQGIVLLRLGGFPQGLGDIGLGEFTLDQPSKSLRSTIGLKIAGTSPFFDKDNLAIIGFTGSQAVHGGATVALLMAACQEYAAGVSTSGTTSRLASLHINFVRPGLGGRAMFSEVDSIRKGKSASVLMARCYHQSDKTVATALATIFS